MELRRIQLVSGAHAADDRNFTVDRPHDDLDLCRHRVHRIDHIGIFRKVELIRIFREIKALSDLDLGIWIDIQDPVAHDFRLILSNCLSRRDDLAVDICQADLIIVHQHKGTDSASRQCLRHISADSADSEDRNLRLRKAVHIFCS